MKSIRNHIAASVLGLAVLGSAAVTPAAAEPKLDHLEHVRGLEKAIGSLRDEIMRADAAGDHKLVARDNIEWFFTIVVFETRLKRIQQELAAVRSEAENAVRNAADKAELDSMEPWIDHRPVYGATTPDKK
ncbi:hypothetical protein BB934_45565 (plasmid) [Microvirga ossetica]|uniref:Secreted protein n=2 Tax=Microvirga ossetica TaxID=1882682 RepID=A0A1B2EZT4_9HYPH|nr:hypothetical protein BB934_45565 [Microvirga ossetica]